jgi:hypothetical protein
MNGNARGREMWKNAICMGMEGRAILACAEKGGPPGIDGECEHIHRANAPLRHANPSKLVGRKRSSLGEVPKGSMAHWGMLKA